ncbi:hypothetical protein SAMN02745244_03238 [Tessaracoccus bendigoensis DSM 12906]|uniref:Uncharacterized protein n=1 Tax=Tessaracoccus bendigoensis DSM 12906 TaxID=1123357 RepID=A0A1M6M3L1_9ACTN|nr:hypothetical protein [Tessaracoccus bendigoensis]SHJ78016.1 hypothetical protein SAMN02745244_03238 [Tessaracoccus bendigoensis DSM 12906]
MKTMSRGCAAVAAAIGLSLAVLPATAQDITPPAGATPVVGMAFEPGDSRLWLAGPEAASGSVVEADSGETWSFGANTESVQALAWSEGRLWVGDIGDTDASRDYVVIFRLGEPDGGNSSYFAYDFEYEDGPRDAKAMLISGRGNIYIVTAGDDPGIYRGSESPSRESMNTLTRVADAPDGVSDGVFLTDGSTMALRTAVGIEYLDAFTWETLVTDTITGASEAESIAVGQDDEIYVGGNPTIRTAQVPASDTTTTVSPAPPGSASQSASGTPSGSASADPDQSAGGDAQPNRSGTLVAVALAGLLAVLAGAVTFFAKR